MTIIPKITALITKVANWGEPDFDDNVHENFTKLKEVCPQINNSIDATNTLGNEIEQIASVVEENKEITVNSALTVGEKLDIVENIVANLPEGSISLTPSDTSAFPSNETLSRLEDKQDTLVSGTNIKTINGKSVLGEGELPLEISDINNLETTLDERANLNTGNTFTGNQAVNGEVKVSDSVAVYDSNNSIDVPLIVKPKGSSFRSTSNVTGYIKIKMPVSWNTTMVSFELTIFNYSTNTSKKFFISGYNYPSNWLTPTAIQLDNSNNKYNVRFGHDGDACCIYIGEPDTAWGYPQISVNNVTLGRNGSAYLDSWSKNWQISFTTTLGTITQTIQAGLDASTLEGLNSENILTNVSEFAVGRVLLCMAFENVNPLQTVSGADLAPLLFSSNGFPQYDEMIDQPAIPGMWKNIHPNRTINEYHYNSNSTCIGYFKRIL